MEKIEESTARGFPEHIYVVLLDDVEIIELEDHVVLIEKESSTAYVFSRLDGKLLDVIAMGGTGEDLLNDLGRVFAG